MINFNNFQIRKKTYGGANGNKVSIVINDELYMLKLPQKATKNENLSYANSSISEYLGSQIYNLLGIKAQDTILGYFTYNNTKRVSVACKDFETNGYVLKDFASVKNQIIDSTSNGYGTDLVDILSTIENQKIIDPVILTEHFWNVFIIDAFIGNWDRHNGNWGFLYNQDNDDIKLAPIYDCGSCLFPQLDEVSINSILKNKQKMNARVYDFPTSAILINGKRINYYDFISSHAYKECDKALKRISTKIDMSVICELIDNIECISDNHKLFLKEILKLRKEIIIDNNIIK